tara:strand:- start:68 stop:658 length:591 start_codon:yes stop_codon:yes gene_type:complete
MKIKITIEPSFSVKWPTLEICINGKQLYDGVCEPIHKNYFIWNCDLEDVHPKNVLEIKHKDKKAKETQTDDEGNITADRAIMLKNLEFDDLSVPEVVLYNNRFYPDWPEQPEYIVNNLYFGFNGSYIFEFSNNSKKMYFNNLLRQEHIANRNNKKIIQLPNGETVESYEFNGELVDGNQKDTITIEQLYQRVINEN